MQISNHAFERYAWRILGVSDKEVKNYVFEKKVQLQNEINELYNKAEYLGKAKLYDNDSHFYIVDEICMVANSINDCIKTVYKVDFGFTPSATKYVIQDTIREIKKLKKQQSKIKDKNKNTIEKMELSINTKQAQLKLLEEKMEVLKKSINCEIDSIKQIKNEEKLIDNTIEEYIVKLVNSLDFKKDCVAGTGKFVENR